MKTYWWFRPSHIALLVAMPIVILAFVASDRFYEQFGAFNTITGEQFFLAWLSILGFAGASWIGEVLVSTEAQAPTPFMRESNFRVFLFGLAAVATAATCVFLSPFVSQPALVVSILSGEPGAAELVRIYVENIPGITSQENLFNLVIVLLMAKPKLTGCRRSKSEKFLLVFVLLLTLLKVLINSERLALIELMVPLAVLVCAQRRRSIALAWAPVAGVIGVFAFFTGTEYLRSWVTYYAAKSDSLLDFAMERMLGYYMTAINNGAYIYAQHNSYLFPIFTGSWLWRLPIPGLIDQIRVLVGAKSPDPVVLKNLLYGLNVEFNNTSGVFAPLTDYGPVMGILIWVGLGYVSGRLYRKFKEAKPLGLLLFPTWYVGVLEISRVFYWGDPRYFPSLVASLAIAAFWSLSLPRSNRRRLAPVVREVGSPG